jgi:imidazole glycerol-phosphate synthase subunit HisH
MRTVLIASPYANLASVARALRKTGADLELTADARVIETASRIVLPGVGAFAAASRWLESTRVAAAIRSAVTRGASLLGICVGHQLLFESSDEIEPARGLALLPGRVSRFDAGLPVPQIGWNRVHHDGDPLFDGIPSGTPFYFVHSFRAAAVPDALEIARADYGESFNAAVRSGRVAGVQFHPEKSSAAGLQLLSNFLGGA